MRCFGTYCAQTLLYCKYSWRIVSTVPLLTDRLSAISRVVLRRFSLTREFTAAIDSWVMTTCAWPWSWHVRCTHTSMTKITTPLENCITWHTLSPIHILHLTVNVGSTNTFCWQKLDYFALSLFGGIHGTIVNRYLASVSVNNILLLSSVYQISLDIHCHVSEKLQSSTAGNNGAPTSVPLSLGQALYIILYFLPQTIIWKIYIGIVMAKLWI